MGSSYVKSESYTKEDNIPFEEKVNYIKSFINSLDYEIILSEDVNVLDDFWYYRLYQVQSRNALLKLAGHYTSILKDEELGMLFESIDLNELLNKSEHSYILTESKREKGKVKSKK